MRSKIIYQPVLLLSFFLFSINSFSATPVLDGAFDGFGVWGAPYASSDGAPGWASAIAGDLYSTFDDDYYYFAVTVTAEPWMNWAFIVNSIDGQGGTSDSWARTISYDHMEAPDYTLRGNFGGYAEYHTWNGASWDGIGSAVAGSEFVATPGFIELRIPKADMGNVDEADVQFYITGNQNEHGSFDAVPDDINVTEWNPPAPTPLSNYQENIILPIELGDFKGERLKNNVTLHWKTLSEVDNDYFNVQRSTNLSTWTTISRIEGAGNSSEIKTYEFVDRQAPKSQVYYRLVQVDFNGAEFYSNVLRLHAENHNTEVYPNPVQDELNIRFNKLASPARIYLYDIHGKLLIEKGVEAGSTKLSLNTNDLISGIYFINIEGNDISFMKKLVK